VNRSPAAETSGLRGKRIWVPGSTGLVGSALVRHLHSFRDCEVVGTTRQDVDLTRQAETEDWIAASRPDIVFLVAAKVGGIQANAAHPASFTYENLAIQTNVIHGAHRAGVQKLIFAGSSCIYPRDGVQPLPEAALLSGPLEPTNEGYAVAKIAGLKLAEAYCREYGRAYLTCMSPNVYGPGDNFSFDGGHVLAGLLRRAHEAKANGERRFVVWGSGTPRREFIHVDDLAEALIFLATREEVPAHHINAGVGVDMSVTQLAEMIREVTGLTADLQYDGTKPDGAPRKLLDSSLINQLGWRPKIPLRNGLEATYRWALENDAHFQD